jgi:pimeloyl-ACP methyl ester carboxylesterase
VTVVTTSTTDGDGAGSMTAMSPAPTPGKGPRLARHTFTLSDGHRIGLAVSGRGVPLVVVHGFTAEGFLYAQTLNRLVHRGFKVVAIDMAGHGDTQGIPTTGGRLGDYADIMSRAVEELGIRKAVLAGHSMGGRVVAQLAAQRPDQVVALLLIDAIVGDQWDLIVNVSRVNPIVLTALGAALLVDTATTLPLLRDPEQAAKLGRLVTPTMVGHALQPWRLLGPGISILRSRGSRRILDKLAADEIPTFVLHGDLDVPVPLCTGASAARRTNGVLVRVRGGSHSWLLKDPECLPAIVDQLLEGRLGAAVRREIHTAGATDVGDLEAHFYERGAPILALTPEGDDLPAPVEVPRPRYAWSIH